MQSELKRDKLWDKVSVPIVKHSSKSQYSQRGVRTSYIAESMSLSSLLLVSWLCSALELTSARRSSSVRFSCFMPCRAAMYLSLNAVKVRFA